MKNKKKKNKKNKKKNKLVNLKVPGPHGVYGYWIKMFVSMQERIVLHL